MFATDDNTCKENSTLDLTHDTQHSTTHSTDQSTVDIAFLDNTVENLLGETLNKALLDCGCTRTVWESMVDVLFGVTFKN